MLGQIIRIYQNSGFFTRLHAFLRYVTCPFLKIEKYVPSQGLIVDYGCGHGVFSHVLALTASCRRIYAVDLSEAKIREAQKTLSDDSRIKFSLDANPEKTVEEAECLVVLDVFCYFTEKEIKQKLALFFKSMRSGAKLIIKDIRKSGSWKYYWLYVQEFIFVKLFKGTQAASLNFRTQASMTSLLRDAGFRVEVHDLSRGYPYPHILYLCSKE